MGHVKGMFKKDNIYASYEVIFDTNKVKSLYRERYDYFKDQKEYPNS